VKVRVRLFAGLVQMVGARNIEVEVEPGASSDVLKARIGELYPHVEPFLRTLVCAVGEEYVAGDYTLHEGDDVALIPPVSGG